MAPKLNMVFIHYFIVCNVNHCSLAQVPKEVRIVYWSLDAPLIFINSEVDILGRPLNLLMSNYFLQFFIFFIFLFVFG